MSFARDVRSTTPTTPLRKGRQGLGAERPAERPSVERPEPSLSRLLDIVTDHGLQLKSLRQEHEALQQETRALRCALSSAGLWRQDKAQHEGPTSPASPADFSPSAGEVLAKLAPQSVSQSSGKRPAAGYPVRHSHMSATAASAAKAEPVGTSSVCSTSAGSECSGSSITSSIKRSSSSGSVGGVRKTKSCPKARPRAENASKTDAIQPSPGAGDGCERGGPSRSAAASPSRQRSLSAGRETSASTPRGSTRRASSGSPLRRSRPHVPPSLYQAAQPLLEASLTKEKRAVALSAVSRALKDGAPPHKWEGPETPLRAAVQARSAEMARLLVEARANPNEKDAKGVCVLHTASFDGLPDLCQTLLRARADANAADQHGQTALFFAPKPWEPFEDL
ncbi:ANKRD36C [Symbiodinium natans]|uniref:ANKRD36C protein n=1 Tax=Symbiodinium natans TaxID=878477 RepID=A0A812R977_9DINO|nr:ANKRD36C [Symbiodinium natans]